MLLLIWLACGLITFIWVFGYSYNKDMSEAWDDNAAFQQAGLSLKEGNQFGFIHYAIFFLLCLLFGPIIWVWELLDKFNAK
jgi:hypothetical protein